jgi:phosphohistidine phosphatase
MKAEGMMPDYILCSSSVRTVTTAQLILNTLLPNVDIRRMGHVDRKFYNISASYLLQEIRETDDKIQKLMVVVHNPGVAELASLLADDEDLASYAPGTLSVFNADINSWMEFSNLSAKLQTVYTPNTQ